MKVNLLVIILSVLVSCKTETKKEAKKEVQEKSIVQKIEEAHGKKAFLANNSVRFSAKIQFGGNVIFDAVATLATDSSKGVLEYVNGDKIYFEHDQVFHSPNMANEQSIRFHAYTWEYFFLFPYKLSDEGTFWSAPTTQELNGNMTNVQKLTFSEGVGDSSDDWYVVYSDVKTNKLVAAAYIVTSGKTVEAAEKDPHAIQYSDYTLVDGIPLASTWTFWEWNETEGLTNVIGGGELSNFEFLTVEDSFFKAPENFISK